MATIMEDIRDAVETEVSAELGASYSKLAYIEDVQKNSFRTNNNRYGIRALALSEISGVTKFATFDQVFEVVLTKGYGESSIDDEKQIQAAFDLRAVALDIYKRLVNNKGGDPASVMQVDDLQIAVPEYLESDKVVIIRASMNITYRLTLL